MNQPTRHNPLDMLSDDESDVPAVPPQRKPMLPKEEIERIARSQGFATPSPIAAPPAAPKSAAAVDEEAGKVPRVLRKRKEPITMTVAGELIARMDAVAKWYNQSRAGASALAWTHWCEEEEKRRGVRWDGTKHVRIE